MHPAGAARVPYDEVTHGRFDDKVALVTGSTHDLGEGIARKPAREGAAGTVVCGRNQGRSAAVIEALEGIGVQAMLVRVDIDWPAATQARMPFARLLKPDEVAKAVAFLASDGSGMMTGAVVDFDQSGGTLQEIPT